MVAPDTQPEHPSTVPRRPDAWSLRLGFIAAFAAIGIAAAATAWSSPILPFFEASCVFSSAPLVILELRPAVIALWGCRANATQRQTIRRFRRHLDTLPETPHPLDG